MDDVFLGILVTACVFLAPSIHQRVTYSMFKKKKKMFLCLEK